MTEVLDLDSEKRVDPKFHGWLCREIMVEQSTLFLLPRDHTKSVTGVVVKIVNEILRDRNQSILLASRTIDRAKSSLGEIRAHLVNPKLIELFPETLYENPGVQKAGNTWTAERINVKRSVVRTDPTVFVAGVGKTITGMHPDKIFLDDIINEETVMTEGSMDSIQRWFAMLQPIASTDCIIRIYGTIYDEFDLYNHLIGLIESGKIGMRVIKRQVEENGVFLYSFYNWDKLREKKILMGERLFRMQYYNNAMSDEERAFPTEKIKDYDELPEAISAYEWVLTIDPAFGTSRTSDNIGYVIVGYDKHNQVWVDKAVRLKCSIVELIRQVYRDHQIYDFLTVGVEKGSWQNALMSMFDYVMTHENMPSLPITDIPLSNEENAKINRIMALVSYFDKGIVHLKKDLIDEDTQEAVVLNTGALRNEMYYFSSSTRQKDDVLDAFSMQPKMHMWGVEYMGHEKNFTKNRRRTWGEAMGLTGDKSKGHAFGWY